ncbi:glycosyltransferase family 4 protein [Nanoarchaeota archaeon]
MKIAYFCQFSHPSICGTWNRVHKVAKEMIRKGHEVHVFSSNLIKNTDKTSSNYEKFEGIKIHRFPALMLLGKSLGESTLFWNFLPSLIKLKPDIIDSQVYRHPHSTFLPIIAKSIKAKAVLTTHAPFVEKDLRSGLLNKVIALYDFLLGKAILNSYSKIIAITEWEKPFLIGLKAKKENIVTIYNGIDKEFLRANKKGDKNTLLFLGRIAPIKDIITLIRALALLPKKTKLLLVGPLEEEYGKIVKEVISELNLGKRVKFLGPVYSLKKKVSLMSQAGIFVLPSKREGMPQSLIEAMAAGKVVISSSTKAGKELVKHGKNGFIFDIGDSEDLAKKITYASDNHGKLGLLRKRAKKFTSNLTWDKIASKVEKVYKSL